ncbi:MT-A70 family methyltransferase [Falsochrobactrum ovis]|uniref:N6-adenosine-specific RNA methylase IME4 n=1 Tax=Falsochrobactrum ovis TaxID=1293442 RepID=A0A364JSQ7_9HYPH|nr:MT-A70 family methyltransferase [Falsochrobactrum ovis]RAK26355.1 N6-adenosine-specific RNA methylase IME4 [Falsochrobactrum ovis]
MHSSLPHGQFGCILADPPWSFKTWSGKTGTPHRSANDHYVTTATSRLIDIPVAEVAAPDCALFMWVVDSHIPDALELGRAWGFEMKTRAFTWRKLAANGQARIGMGYWTRKQTELCFLFTRGKPRRKDKGVREIIDAPRREHSRKPDEQYERIEALVDGPYLELFARQAWPGWTAWGNETGKYAADISTAANDNDLFGRVA